MTSEIFFFQSSFDADPITLCNLALLQEGANLMGKAIELIIRPWTGSVPQLSSPDLTIIQNKLGGKRVIEIQSLVKTVVEASELAQRLVQVCQKRPLIFAFVLPLLDKLTNVFLSKSRYIHCKLRPTLSVS